VPRTVQHVQQEPVDNGTFTPGTDHHHRYAASTRLVARTVAMIRLGVHNADTAQHKTTLRITRFTTIGIIRQTSGRNNLTQSHIAAAHGRFSRTRQVALCASHVGTLTPPGEYIELLLPSAQPSPQPKRQIARFSRFCTAHGRYFTMGDPFPQNPTRIWTPI